MYGEDGSHYPHMTISSTTNSEDSSIKSFDDDSNLSSTSLLYQLIESSSTELSSFHKLSFDEKFDKARGSVKMTFLADRESHARPPPYEKDIEENMRRVASDRNKSYQQSLPPNYAEEHKPRRSFMRPHLGSFTMPLMEGLGTDPDEHRRPSWKIRRSGYVGELLDYMDSNPSRPSREQPLASIQLSLLKKKVREIEGNPVSEEDIREDIDEDLYTDEHKEIMEQQLKGLHRMKESVFVPYGKLSYLQGLEGDAMKSAGTLLFPSRQDSIPGSEARVSYDDFYRRADFSGFYKKYHPCLRRSQGDESSSKKPSSDDRTDQKNPPFEDKGKKSPSSPSPEGKHENRSPRVRFNLD